MTKLKTSAAQMVADARARIREIETSDLIAMLDEETEYLATVYCKSPKELFDVGSIIQFMERERAGHGKRNAMLLVIRYLEEQGGCS